MELDKSDGAVRGDGEDFYDQQDGEQDLPPEYCHYRDEGCELAESCLECPFPECIYDKPGGKQRWLKKLRDREMARLFTAGGKGVKELSKMFNVSQRTVQRALKTALDNPEIRGQKDE